MSSANINDSFFNITYQEVWRRLIPPGLSEAECDFIEDVCSLQPAHKVLDIMCGYGRHAIELAKRGYTITAVDNAQAYIQEIAGTASAQRLPIQTETASALTVKLHQQYNAILCMGNSFAFFDKAQALALLQKLSAHLLPGGSFIINSWMVAEIAIRHFREKEWTRVGDYKYMMDYRFEFAPSRILSEHTLVTPGGQVETIQGVDYIFTLAELEDMFAAVGLSTTGLYSTPRKKPFRMGDNRIYIVARKAT